MTEDRAHLRTVLRDRLDHSRTRTRALVAPLGDDDLHWQYDPIMSPLVWDLGHVSNFEELWLVRVTGGRAAHDRRLDAIYNPFENPRWIRGDLEMLDRAEADLYLDAVRRESLDVLTRVAVGGDDPLLRAGYVFTMVTQHETQHQETMLQALDLRDDLAPYEPALQRSVPNARRVDDTQRIVVPAGTFTMGTDDRSAAYDNERPAHDVDVGAFAIDRYPVTARRYSAFVRAGGYERPELWSDRGREWLTDTGVMAPQGWIPEGDGGWSVRRFGHVVPLDPAEPVQHVSFWEAEAFCGFTGGRLPTEAEWEKAARWDPVERRSRAYPWGEEPPSRERANLGQDGWGPAPVGSYPKGASAFGVEQLIGDVHEWTSSDFTGYPGYVSFPYAEYSEVFFGDGSKVLRGSSWASSPLVARATFRNWDFPQRRQIFSGIRVAYDLEGPLG